MRKLDLIQVQISCAAIVQLISTFVFPTQIHVVQSHSFPKIQIATLEPSVALQGSLCRTWLETPDTGSLVSQLK